MAQQRDFSEHTAEVIDDEISTLLKHREVEIGQLLKTNRALLDTVANALLEKETLEFDEIRTLIDACAKAVHGAEK
jgi:cell division protease FtsH